MKKLERGIMNVTGYFLAALMFLMMVDIFAAVLVRYVFHTALNFSEELGRYVFVWIVFIGMARCIAAGKHVALDLVPGFLKGKSGRNLYAVIYTPAAPGHRLRKPRSAVRPLPPPPGAMRPDDGTAPLIRKYNIRIRPQDQFPLNGRTNFPG